MFDKQENRYVTRAIDEEIHPEIISSLWQLIDQLKRTRTTVDYLQIFELKEVEGNQIVKYRQEVPTYSEQWVLNLREAQPVTTTIWCMDDDGDDHQTMLYPSDY